MAKLSSTAQHKPTAAPLRSTRQTRSVSAEPVENARPSNSRGRKAQHQSDGENNTLGNMKGRKPKSKPAPPDLTTVEEDVQVEQEVDADAADDEVELQAHARAQTELADLADLPRERRLSIAASAMSGTTAKTSFSQEELELLDHDVMVDELPKLAAAAQDLAQLLLPDGVNTEPDTWKEVRRTGSKLHKLHRRRLLALDMYKQSFGSMPYIRPDLVLRGVLSTPGVTKLPTGPWRPDDLLLKINLASMLNNLLINCDISNWNSECSTVLEQLLSAFPACIAGGDFTKPALEFYLNIAAQVAITHLEAHSTSSSTFSPYETIDEIFFDGEGVLRHMEALGISRLDDAAQRSAFRHVKQLADALKAPFDEGSTTNAGSGVGRLKAQFPWDMFQENIVRYAHIRSAQLQQRIAQAGGIDQILANLGKEAQSREDDKDEEYEEYARETKRKSLEAKRKSLPGTSSLQNIMSSFSEARRIAAFAEDDLPEPILPRPTVVGSEPLSVGEDEVEDPDELPKALESPVPSQSSLQVSLGFQEQQRQNAARHKRRLIDAQPNAQRVANIDDDEELQTQHTSSRPTARASLQFRAPISSIRSKRSAADMDDDDDVPDPTQDEGFQTATHNHAGAAQRRREVSFAPINRPSASVEPADGAPGPSSRQSTAPGPSPAKRQRKNPGSTIPPPLPIEDQARPDEERMSLYERAKVIAKRDRVTARMSKPQQVRRPWTDDEEAHLIDLIERHGDDGISYALIKQIDDGDEDPKLRARSAEDIRFKARNMKATLLLSGCALPENWEKVVLDKKSIDKLHARGIEYHQERLRHPLNIDFSN